MNEEYEGELMFGFPEEWEKFGKRHPLWPLRFPNLTRAIETCFCREAMMSEPADKFVHLYGRMCAEDFMEILLVCGNGYGTAGTKLLRSMYEHTVTLRYLHEHPDEVALFLDYNKVQQYKLMKPIQETIGSDALPPEIISQVTRKYEEVKPRFMVTACEKCGTKRVNYTWNKLDFVSMAKQTGELGKRIVQAYFLPLRHAHSSIGGLMERLEPSEERMAFRTEDTPDVADEALMMAHGCLFDVLRVQDERFHVAGLSEQLQTCLQDYFEIWVPDSPHLRADPC